MTTYFDAQVWQTNGRWHVVLREIGRNICPDVVGTWEPNGGTETWFAFRQDAIRWAEEKKGNILRERNGNTPVETVQL